MIYSTFKNLIPLLISVMAMVGVHTEAKADMANPNLRKIVTNGTVIRSIRDFSYDKLRGLSGIIILRPGDGGKPVKLLLK